LTLDPSAESAVFETAPEVRVEIFVTPPFAIAAALGSVVDVPVLVPVPLCGAPSFEGVRDPFVVDAVSVSCEGVAGVGGGEKKMM